MDEKKNIDISKEMSITRAYFIFLIVVLMLVQIVDTYCTVVLGAIPSQIAKEFLSEYSENQQNAILALGAGVSSIGAYTIFFSQYLTDKIGRKKMLAITVAGMGVTCVMIMLATSYIMYVILALSLGFFQRSDVWLIYINEESDKKKRAFYTNIILLAGLIGAFIMVILRSIFITDTASNWRAMMLFPIIIGVPLSIFILLTLKESSKYQLMKEDGSLKEKKSFKEDIKAIFKTENRKSYAAILIMSLIFGATAVYMLLFEKYISDVGTLSQIQISIIFLWTVFAVIIAYLANGILSDRVGRKPLIYLWSILLPTSVILWVFGSQNPKYAFILVQIGYATTHISYWGLFGMLRISALELLPTERRGAGLGLRSVCGSIGGTIGLLLSSVVILIVGLATTFIVFVILLFVLLPINYLFLKETRGVELSEVK